MDIQAILFDMDGVLVDSEPLIQQAIISGLKEYGVAARREDFKPFVGAGEDNCIAGIAQKYGVSYRPEMKVRIFQIYQEIIPGKLKAFDGAVDLLKHLKAKGIKTALASSADWFKIRANLKVAGIPDTLFTALVSGEDIGPKKPAPDIFIKAAAAVGTGPAHCVVIEDAVNGIKAARNAGMRCIAIATTFDLPTLEKENPDYICARISEVGPVIARMSPDSATASSGDWRF